MYFMFIYVETRECLIRLLSRQKYCCTGKNLPTEMSRTKAINHFFMLFCDTTKSLAIKIRWCGGLALINQFMKHHQLLSSWPGSHLRMNWLHTQKWKNYRQNKFKPVYSWYFVKPAGGHPYIAAEWLLFDCHTKNNTNMWDLTIKSWHLKWTNGFSKLMRHLKGGCISTGMHYRFFNL